MFGFFNKGSDKGHAITVALAGTMGSGKTTLLSAFYLKFSKEKKLVLSSISDVKLDRHANSFVTSTAPALQEQKWPDASTSQDRVELFWQLKVNDRLQNVNILDYPGEDFYNLYRDPDSRDAINQSIKFRDQIRNADILFVIFSYQQITDLRYDKNKDNVVFAYRRIISEALQLKDLPIRFVVTCCDECKASAKAHCSNVNSVSDNSIMIDFISEQLQQERGEIFNTLSAASPLPIQIIPVSSVCKTVFDPSGKGRIPAQGYDGTQSFGLEEVFDAIINDSRSHRRRRKKGGGGIITNPLKKPSNTKPNGETEVVPPPSSGLRERKIDESFGVFSKANLCLVLLILLEIVYSAGIIYKFLFNNITMWDLVLCIPAIILFGIIAGIIDDR